MNQKEDHLAECPLAELLGKLGLDKDRIIELHQVFHVVGPNAVDDMDEVTKLMSNVDIDKGLKWLQKMDTAVWRAVRSLVTLGTALNAAVSLSSEVKEVSFKKIAGNTKVH